MRDTNFKIQCAMDKDYLLDLLVSVRERNIDVNTALDEICARDDADTGEKQCNLPVVSNLAKFCKKIVKQEDCPPEFIEIVNKEFWNLI